MQIVIQFFANICSIYRIIPIVIIIYFFGNEGTWKRGEAPALTKLHIRLVVLALSKVKKHCKEINYVPT